MLICGVNYNRSSTNEAKDKNNQKKFEFLHNLSVISTVIIFLTNLSLVFLNI